MKASSLHKNKPGKIGYKAGKRVTIQRQKNKKIKMLVENINEILSTFNPIGLAEMDNVRHMDRIDTKYILSVSRIPDLLRKMDGDCFQVVILVFLLFF